MQVTLNLAELQAAHKANGGKDHQTAIDFEGWLPLEKAAPTDDPSSSLGKRNVEKVSDGAEGIRVVVVMFCYDFLRLPST